MSDRVSVDPVVVTMAVRYCLGRQTYAPGLMSDQVLMVLPRLGDQRDIIIRDITEWLAEDWHDHPAEKTWRELLLLMKARKAADEYEAGLRASGAWDAVTE